MLTCGKCSQPFERPNPRGRAPSYCPACNGGRNAARALKAILGHSEFLAVDGEGVGNGTAHRYVLLAVGDEQREWPDGLRDITEVFDFLYSQYDRTQTYVGFYLGYDFNMWLRWLPFERAHMLLTKEGQAIRSRTRSGGNPTPFPVRYKGWEFDLLNSRRFKLRPDGASEWMYINDVGPFFQCSLLSALDPKKWPHPVVTQEQFDILQVGKERRATAALDDEMRDYTRTENRALSKLMARMQEGYGAMGVKLNRMQWFGPGQAAQQWMRQQEELKRANAAIHELPGTITAPIIASYYGGWFEILAHGHVSGVSFEYDINSAYPWVIASLPCVCGPWTRHRGKPRPGAKLSLCHVIVDGRDRWLGPLPYRTSKGSVCRPRRVRGWYWHHEIEAAKRAGLIHNIKCLETVEYHSCGHKSPLRGIAGLYDQRFRVGKDTPEGKALKLVYNSTYGKTAQSIGVAPMANAAYASLITSGCRTRILEAIASHPGKTSALLMVATDAVFFTSPHHGLSCSETLGDWSAETRHNLTLFKPGVYWDDKARADIAAGDAPRFKSRGISARDFGGTISGIDDAFRTWRPEQLPDVEWPRVQFRTRFAQVSASQAIRMAEGFGKPASRAAVYRQLAGLVMQNRRLLQDSNPEDKRNRTLMHHINGVYRSEPWSGENWPETAPYGGRFGLTDWDEMQDGDGSLMMSFREALLGDGFDSESES